MEKGRNSLQKTVKIGKYLVKVNDAWKIFLFIGVIVNLILNYNLKQIVNDQEFSLHETNIKVYNLLIENRDLKAANQELLNNMVLFNRSFEDFSLPIWNKVKRGYFFYSNYFNPAYEEKYFTPKGLNRYENLGKTNYNVTDVDCATICHANDMEVALSGNAKSYTEPLIHHEDGTKYYVKVFKWRTIQNNKDTLVYGMELPKDK
tara:strand:- start:1834 stop:2445 length:612 start_codon:yes stop_codon:yes gene_type:complete